MRYVAPAFFALIGLLWTAMFVFAFQYWKWDGAGCFLESLPGLFVFMGSAICSWIQVVAAEKK